MKENRDTKESYGKSQEALRGSHPNFIPQMVSYLESDSNDISG